MKIYLDNLFPPQLVMALRERMQPEHDVIHCRDRYPAEITDAELMPQLAAESRMVMVTVQAPGDLNPHFVAAWRQARHAILFLTPDWFGLPFTEQADKLAQCLPEFLLRVKKSPRRGAFQATVNGRIGFIRPA